MLSAFCMALELICNSQLCDSLLSAQKVVIPHSFACEVFLSTSKASLSTTSNLQVRDFFTLLD